MGKERACNRRFLLGVGTGRQPGRVVQEYFFSPRLRVKSHEQLNAWLPDRCLAYAKAPNAATRYRTLICRPTQAPPTILTENVPFLTMQGVCGLPSRAVSEAETGVSAPGASRSSWSIRSGLSR